MQNRSLDPDGFSLATMRSLSVLLQKLRTGQKNLQCLKTATNMGNVQPNSFCFLGFVQNKDKDQTKTQFKAMMRDYKDVLHLALVEIGKWAFG